MIKEDYGAQNPRSLLLRMIAGGGGGGLTIQQPENNIVRGAYYALISALSGTQTMALCSYDEAYTIPSEKAARISLRTMQILMDEIGLCDTVDPLAGSYFVEQMTERMEREALDYIERIDEMGGVIAAIESGFQQREIAEASYTYQRQVDTKEKTIVGVNAYDGDDGEAVEVLRVGEIVEREQLARLEALKQRRDNARVEQRLADLRATAETDGNLLPPMLEAVREYATIGEVSAALVPVFGRYREVSII